MDATYVARDLDRRQMLAAVSHTQPGMARQAMVSDVVCVKRMTEVTGDNLRHKDAAGTYRHGDVAALRVEPHPFDGVPQRNVERADKVGHARVARVNP